LPAEMARQKPTNLPATTRNDDSQRPFPHVASILANSKQPAPGSLETG